MIIEYIRYRIEPERAHAAVKPYFDDIEEMRHYEHTEVQGLGAARAEP